MKYFVFTVALLLIGVGVVGQYGSYVGLPGISVKDPVTGAVVFYETKSKHTLPSGVKATIDAAPKYGVMALDWDVLGVDNKPPAVLVPYLNACGSREQPMLVLQRDKRTYEALPCPNSPEQLQELVR